MKKTKLFERITEAALIVLLLFLILGAASPEIRNGFYKSLQLTLTPSENATAIIHHVTSGKIEFATSEDAVADLEIIGVNQAYTLNLGAMVDGFLPLSADTTNGFGLAIDFIVDSLRFYSSDEAAGDSAIFTFYNTLNPDFAVLISGPDTLIINGIVDYTGLSAAARDFDVSINQKFAVYVDVKGTYTNALIQVFGRSYDVR